MFERKKVCWLSRQCGGMRKFEQIFLFFQLPKCYVIIPLDYLLDVMFDIGHLPTGRR